MASRRSTTGGPDTFALRILVSGNGEVTPGGLGKPCSDDCTFHALRNKSVEVTATGKEDVFQKWSDRCGKAPTCKIKMTSDVVIHAEFGLDRYEEAWAVPMTSTECVRFNWLAAGSQVVVSGGFEGAVTIGHIALTSSGKDDAVVATLSTGSGAVAWAQRFGGKEFDWAHDPQVLPGGDIIAGLHLTVDRATPPASGQVDEHKVIWLNKDNGAVTGAAPVLDNLEAIRGTDDGGAVAISSKQTSATISRFSSAAPPSTVWSTILPASGGLSVRQVSVGPDSDVFLVGRLKGVPQFGAPWRGVPRLISPWKQFLVRLDGVTGVIKSARWIDWNDGRVATLIAGTRRMLFVAGGVEHGRYSYTDAFIAALSLDGDVLWEHVYRRTIPPRGSLIHSVTASKSGILLSGETFGEIDVGNRRIGTSAQETAFILELSAEGDVLWSYEQPRDRGEALVIAQDDDGDLYVTGPFRQPFQFAGQTIAPDPSHRYCSSAYVAKFARTGDRSKTSATVKQPAP